LAGSISIEITGGGSVVFIGANGAGKTRLGVFIDRTLSASQVEVHRIAAHRSLLLNPNVVPPSFEVATKRLRFGTDQGNFQNKDGFRWQNKPETTLLNDFDHLLSALYAENNDVSVSYRQSQIQAPSAERPPKAKLDKLKEIWETILPHRELVVIAGNIKTRTPGSQSQEYAASEMSDGERVIFYLIGQSLLAQPSTLLIFDEPELHINKSVLSRLWDAIESARPDCAFIYITHDVEFASSRHAATKYAVRSYQKIPNEAWDIEAVPENAGIPDDVVATIIGSRRPVLFVEGDGGSLDSSLYRRVFDGFTVIAVGSCEHVIHTVASFGARPELHHVGCAGLVDADGRTDEEAVQLAQNGIYRLPVSEVENLLLLPSVFLALAKELRFEEREAQAKLCALRSFVFDQANRQIDQICLRYTRRRVDAEMKKIGLSSTEISALDSELKAAASRVDAYAIFSDIKSRIAEAIADQDYEKVLLHYDNKGLLSEVARQFSYQQKALEQFIGRILRSDEPSELHAALAAHLPTVVPRP
jgi:energy-coupling factor transporter ATP-binding protein EcfA2